MKLAPYQCIYAICLFYTITACQKPVVIPAERVPSRAENLVFHKISHSPEGVYEIIPVNKNLTYFASERADSFFLYYIEGDNSALQLDTIFDIQALAGSQVGDQRYAEARLLLSADKSKLEVHISADTLLPGVDHKGRLTHCLYKRLNKSDTWHPLIKKSMYKGPALMSDLLITDSTAYIADITGQISELNLHTFESQPLFNIKVNCQGMSRSIVDGFRCGSGGVYLNSACYSVWGGYISERIYFFLPERHELQKFIFYSESDTELSPIAYLANFDSIARQLQVPVISTKKKNADSVYLLLNTLNLNGKTVHADTILSEGIIRKKIEFAMYVMSTDWRDSVQGNEISYQDLDKKIISSPAVYFFLRDSLLVKKIRDKSKCWFVQYSYDKGNTWAALPIDTPFYYTILTEAIGTEKKAAVYLLSKNNEVLGYCEKGGAFSNIGAIKYSQTRSAVQMNVNLQNIDTTNLKVELFLIDSAVVKQFNTHYTPLPVKIENNFKRHEIVIKADLSVLNFKINEGDKLSYFLNISNKELHIAREIPYQIYKNNRFAPYIKYVYLAIGVFLFYILIFSLLYTKPLWLLWFYCSKYYPLLDKIPGNVGKWIKEINAVLFSNYIIKSPWMQNAWVQSNTPVFTVNFSTLKNVRQREEYCSIPIKHLSQSKECIQILEGPDVEKLKEMIHHQGKNTSIMQIIGVGGAGKTALAIKIAKLFSDTDLLLSKNISLDYASLPLLVEDETENFIQLIENLIQDTSAQYINKEFVSSLLKNKRILIIVDALSEKSAAYQRQVQEAIRFDKRLRNVIITSRKGYDFSKKTSAVLLYPQPISSKNLISFTTELLEKREISVFDTLESQIGLATKLSAIIQYQRKEMDITPILISIAVNQIERIVAGLQAAQPAPAKIPYARVLDQLPSSIPSLYSEYIKRLNKGFEDYYITDNDLLELIELIAAACLTANYLPHEVDIDRIRPAFIAKHFTFPLDVALKLLDRSGLIRINNADPNATIISFILDPLCEVMAAFYLAKASGSSHLQWRKLYENITLVKEFPFGFCQALLLIHRKYWKTKGWVNPDELPQVGEVEGRIFAIPLEVAPEMYQ